MSEITVAVVSSIAQIGDVEANLVRVETWIKKAVERGAELVVFPELALSGYAYDPTLQAVAEPVPGPTTRTLEQLTHRHGVTLSAGMLEQEGDVYYNAQIVVGPEGYQGRYRKHYPTPREREVLETLPGRAYPTFEVHGIRFGVNICADSRQLDTIESLAVQGVRLVHNPHANFLSLGRHAEEWTRGKLVYYLDRVIACRAHILINNLAGTVRDSTGASYDFSGGAMILDPLGQVVARTTQADNGPAMIVATLETDLARYVPPFERKNLQVAVDA